MAARAYNITNSGFVRVRPFSRFLVKHLGLSLRTIRRLVEAGEGTFWTRELNRAGQPAIRLFSLERVSAMLVRRYREMFPDKSLWDVSRFLGVYPGQPQGIPVDRLTSLHRRRAEMHIVAFGTPLKATVIRQKRAKPIARATMERITGTRPWTQRRYEATARARVEANLDIDVMEGPDGSKLRRAYAAPNVYRNRAVPLPGGAARKVAGTLRRRGLLRSWGVRRRRFSTGREYTQWSQKHPHPADMVVYVRIPGPPLAGRVTLWQSETVKSRR